MSRKKTNRSYRNIRITAKGYEILAALDRGTYKTKCGNQCKRDARGRFVS